MKKCFEKCFEERLQDEIRRLQAELQAYQAFKASLAAKRTPRKAAGRDEPGIWIYDHIITNVDLNGVDYSTLESQANLLV
ncbi:MAG TPA: hypothetical protein VED01_05140 [Burkholderiales bacterium]|nr:hypothetical protein [Burkholderiales bacterium]